MLGGTYNDNIVEQNVRECVTEALKSGKDHRFWFYEHGFFFQKGRKGMLEKFDLGDGVTMSFSPLILKKSV